MNRRHSGNNDHYYDDNLLEIDKKKYPPLPFIVNIILMAGAVVAIRSTNQIPMDDITISIFVGVYVVVAAITLWIPAMFIESSDGMKALWIVSIILLMVLGTFLGIMHVTPTINFFQKGYFRSKKCIDEIKLTDAIGSINNSDDSIKETIKMQEAMIKEVIDAYNNKKKEKIDKITEKTDRVTSRDSKMNRISDINKEISTLFSKNGDNIKERYDSLSAEKGILEDEIDRLNDDIDKIDDELLVIEEELKKFDKDGTYHDIEYKCIDDMDKSEEELGTLKYYRCRIIENENHRRELEKDRDVMKAIQKESIPEMVGKYKDIASESDNGDGVSDMLDTVLGSD